MNKVQNRVNKLIEIYKKLGALRAIYLLTEYVKDLSYGTITISQVIRL
jgi:hypothetical protein